MYLLYTWEPGAASPWGQSKAALVLQVGRQKSSVRTMPNRANPLEPPAISKGPKGASVSCLRSALNDSLSVVPLGVTQSPSFSPSLYPLPPSHCPHSPQLPCLRPELQSPLPFRGFIPHESYSVTTPSVNHLPGFKTRPVGAPPLSESVHRGF